MVRGSFCCGVITGTSSVAGLTLVGQRCVDAVRLGPLSQGQTSVSVWLALARPGPAPLDHVGPRPGHRFGPDATVYLVPATSPKPIRRMEMAEARRGLAAGVLPGHVVGCCVPPAAGKLRPDRRAMVERRGRSLASLPMSTVGLLAGQWSQRRPALTSPPPLLPPVSFPARGSPLQPLSPFDRFSLLSTRCHAGGPRMLPCPPGRT